MAGDNAQWFIYQNNEQLGPFSLGDLTQKLTQKQIVEDAFAFTEGFKDWTPIKDVPQLAPHVSANAVTAEAPAVTAAPAASASVESMWSVNKDGQTLGSFSVDQIKEKLSSGEIADSDYVWTDGWEDWVPIKDSPDWKSKLPSGGNTVPASKPAPAGAAPEPAPEPEPQPAAVEHFSEQETKAEQTREEFADEIRQTESTDPGLPAGGLVQRSDERINTFDHGAPSQVSSTNYDDFEDEDFGKKKTSKKRLAFLLVLLIGLGGTYYVTQTPSGRKILHQFQPLVSKVTGKKTPRKKIFTSDKVGQKKTASVSNANMGTLLPLIADVKGATGISQQLYSDVPMLAVKHPPNGDYHLVGYADKGPYFFHHSFTSQGSVTLTPALPLAGSATFFLYSKTVTGDYELVSTRNTAITNKTPKALSPLPQRVEVLSQWTKSIRKYVGRTVKYSKRSSTWNKAQTNIWQGLEAQKPAVQKCLHSLHLPAQCALLAQYWADAVKLFKSVSMKRKRVKSSVIKQEIGVSTKDLVKSMRKTRKEIEAFIEAPKAVENISKVDIHSWLRHSQSRP